MGLDIENVETERRVRALAALIGEELTSRAWDDVQAELRALDELSVLDDTSPQQAIEELHDEAGLPA